MTKDTSDKSREAKNARIKQSIKATQERRKKQKARVFSLKIVHNRLNSKQREALQRVFLEAKWLKNDVLNFMMTEENSLSDYHVNKTVKVKNKEGVFEDRELKYLGSQMKQSVISQVKNDLKALKSSKDRGRRVGRLKFCSEYTSIDLKQYGTTYKIHNKKSSRMKIQNIPGYVKVSGLNQILDKYELANAKLVQRPSGYYLMVTAFEYKSDIVDNKVRNTVVGVDMGVATHITFSDGTHVNCLIEETDRLKSLQRKLSRQIKGSNNYVKTVQLIRREYEKITNRKNDFANKLCHEILKNDYVFIQDEMISSWKVNYGRKTHYSILGRVKENLKRHERVYVLPKSAATTKTCRCVIKNNIKLSDRTYTCSSCGYSQERDIHAAQNMVIMGANALLPHDVHHSKYTFVPLDQRDVKPVETMLDWSTSVFQLLSVKQEAAGSSVRQ